MVGFVILVIGTTQITLLIDEIWAVVENIRTSR
jgi:hypothetical protein